MKNILMIAMMAISFTASYGARAEDGETHDKIVPINDVYIPSGFDSGSDAFVVVNGLFSNGCYKLKDVKVDHVGPVLHEVTTMATVTEGLCIAVMVPFHREAQLGRLAVGTHQVRFMNGDGTYMEKQITIEQ